MDANVQMRMSVIHSTNREDYIQIEIRDSVSRLIIANIELEKDQVAEFLTQSIATGKATLTDRPQLVGKKREHKNLPVFVNPDSYDSEKRLELLKESAVKHEKDGWKLSVIEWNNRHYNHETKQYHAGFTRYVEETE